MPPFKGGAEKKWSAKSNFCMATPTVKVLWYCNTNRRDHDAKKCQDKNVRIVVIETTNV
jgi:hypothetical protein